ncbi:MAG TPA: hypothetical protein VGO60_17725 [Iamia sp.]|nr:hypothetical protein [Iamia sp.]
MTFRYDSPGFLPDFASIPGQADAWSAAVSGWFDEDIEIVRKTLVKGEKPQFYNAVHGEPSGALLDQPMVWNALSGTYRNRFGRAQALVLADQLVPLTARQDGPGCYYQGPQWVDLFYRPNDEYCEWRVTRDESGDITAVTFTSEPPEYWQALHGDTLSNMNGVPTYPCPGDRDLLVALYRELVSPDVQYEDLICAEDLVDYSIPSKPQVIYAKGTYNPYNRWNTTDGIVHLTQPANSLSAEIFLAAGATTLYRGADGVRVSDPDALICCAAYGGVNRCSDPTIGSSVNELAALGAAITLRNPVGLSMHHIDLAGFAAPDGSPVTEDYFRVLRGQELGLIERAVFAVPDGAEFTVSDLTIGGVPIAYGGQIAERITVNLVGRAGALGSFTNTPLACVAGCCGDGEYLAYRQPTGAPCRPGMVPVFVDTSPVAVPLTTKSAVATATAAAASAPPAPHHRHRTRSA